jgi:hypothetical protein
MNWPEIVSGASDVIGLAGAWLLARPFLDRQEARDAADVLADTSAAKDAGVETAIKQSATALRRHLIRHASGDFRKGLWGARLIAVSFALKITPFAIGTWNWATSFFGSSAESVGDLEVISARAERL